LVPAARRISTKWFDINKKGIKTPVVAQISKQGFIYAFDRRDGAPIWPIEEWAVLQSTIETVWTSPTQPFATMRNHAPSVYSKDARRPLWTAITKPPFGTATAIDMNTGEHVWKIANADTPAKIANHPKLAGVDIPRTGYDERVGLLVTGSLLFAGEGSGLYAAGCGGKMFRAYDKQTGEILWEFELPARQTGLPMTYAIDGEGHAGELVGLRLF
jgi:glucose dehydrogenase